MTDPRFPFFIRVATAADLSACKKIADQHRAALPYVRRVSLEREMKKGEVFVADQAGEVVGFVRWYTRRDGWHTIHEIGVRKGRQGNGIGHALLYAVPCPIRLKCPVDLPANTFYRNAGMELIGVEPAARPRNIWVLHILVILCAGGNRSYAQIARDSQMPYGVRHTNKAYAWPFMLDVKWSRFKDHPQEWDRYMDIVREYRPVIAMAVDYEFPEQRAALHQQIADLRAAGVLRVLVCPKFDGALADIPQDCVVAVSVPSRYAGYLPDFADLRGRQIHLLGGTPKKQRDLISKLAGHGAVVISTDLNSHLSAASRGSTYTGWNWQRPTYRDNANIQVSGIISGQRIRRHLNVEVQQMPLALERKD
jgi:GNAT superfamily N-acetyltransferase